MTRHFHTCLLLFIMLTVAQSNYAQKPVAKENLKQTKDEWLQSLPEKVRDSIVYKEWKEAQSAIEKKELVSAQARIDAALADPATTSLDLSYYPGMEIDPRVASLKKLRKITITKARKLNVDKLFDLLSKLPDLRVLVLNDGGYSALPSSVGNLTALDSFTFRNNNIKALPETFTKLKSLSYLCLEHNAYLYDDDLCERLKGMNVRTLDLSACGLLELNGKIGEVKSLQQLDLSVNDIKALPASFAQLSNLEVLSLRQNLSLNLVDVSKTLGGLPKLSALYLDQCGLASLPVEIGSLTGLKVLSLRENVLTSLPATFISLKNLEELYLGSPNNAFRLNVLQNLPPGFGGFSKLRILDLSGNQLASLGTDFNQLTELQWLDLSRNQLPGFPASLTSLTKLRFINLNRNRIAEIASGVSRLTQLDSLFLDGDFFNKADKKIKSLPDDLCQMKNLKKLTLKDNVIEKVPACIDGLSALVSLDLRGNLITLLPASFSKLQSLQVLDLKSNDLQGLPADFSNLHLTDLNVAMNLNADMSSMIAQISRIKTLRILDISYNNLTRAQAEPLISALPGCKIINVDYYNKEPLPGSTSQPSEQRQNRPILDDGPKRNK
ncbi:MAG: leucine-rich repeat domain-containing protein [Bacteroidetes bacterium]|nr:leucine-rich repeat domain-containing protein [Bacteroidota bacterium]